MFVGCHQQAHPRVRLNISGHLFSPISHPVTSFHSDQPLASLFTSIVRRRYSTPSTPRDSQTRNSVSSSTQRTLLH
ncbi:hypothetical protein HanIR_Chr16g0834791 [Helianthus annuus]|nr:hypothetical protein HanIR_Chr16g0834791 [Helianthus annuus]